jgi:hypothetical protein
MTCFTQAGGVYVPGYYLSGAPVAPTCMPGSPLLSGSLAATGLSAICCAP